MGDRAKVIFQKLDADHDGEITMEEFVEGYLKMHNPREAAGGAAAASGTTVIGTGGGKGSSRY